MRRIALLLAFALAPVAAHAQLVDGVVQVALAANGAPGALFPYDPAWEAIVGGDDDTSFPSTLVAARELGAGRVAVGHGGLLASTEVLDTGRLLENVSDWLDGDGAIGIPDFGVFRAGFGAEPGPSGLACAGAVPCP